MIICGIDPDTTHTAVAFGTKHQLKAVYVIEVPRKPGQKPKIDMIREIGIVLPGLLRIWQPKVLVVEGQAIHHKGKAPPADILSIAQVAGAAAGCNGVGGVLLIPEPHEWKGSVPKPIHQMRTYRAFGLAAEQRSDYAYPLPSSALNAIHGANELSQSDWKHVGDAAGMVLWGAKQAVALEAEAP